MLHEIAAKATAGIEKVRIKVSDLKIGMYVSQLDRSWVDSPFLVQGFVIRDKKQLQQLQALCRYVYIDIKRGTVADTSSYAHKPKDIVTYQTSSTFHDNLPAATEIHSQAKSVVKDMFDAFRSGDIFSTKVIRKTIEDCVENIIANPESMLWLSMIKHKDEYTAEHSLNVALLSIALGRAEGLERDKLKALGECAMLHDVGKVKIPDNILNKEGNLSEEEFAVMKMHTVHGKKLLLSQPAVAEMAVEVALSHHEKLDGSGYPNGLTDAQIPYIVKIVAIADAYDAMTSGRIYCEAKPPSEALRIMLASKHKTHDAALVDKFVECLGVYPIGSIAELNSGEVGLVLPCSSEKKLQPPILIVRSADKAICQPKIITIGSSKREDNNKTYMVRAIHADGKYNIRMSDFSELALQYLDN